MTDLSRDARSLVARVRRRDGPSAADRERVRARLESAWSAGEASVEKQVSSATAAFGIQPPLVVALILSIGFLAPDSPRVAAPPVEPRVVVHAHAALPPPPRPSETAPPPAAADPIEAKPVAHAVRATRARSRPGSPGPRRTSDPVSIPAEAPSSDRQALDTTPAEPRAALESPVEPVEARATPAESPTPERGMDGPRPATTTADDGAVVPVLRRDGFSPQPIAEELAWVEAAQRALREEQPSRALRLVQEHAFRFPRGALAPERITVEALALCALQRKAAARQVLSNLVTRAPRSPLIDRVRRECEFR